MLYSSIYINICTVAIEDFYYSDINVKNKCTQYFAYREMLVTSRTPAVKCLKKVVLTSGVMGLYLQ